MKLTDDNHCFACGEDNPKGLHLEFEHSDDGQTTWTQYVPDVEHQGWSGIVHGGITAVVMDEVAAKLVQNMGISAVTGRLDVRYLKPAMVGEPLQFRATLLRQSGRLIEVKTEARNENGALVATALAAIYRVE